MAPPSATKAPTIQRIMDIYGLSPDCKYTMLGSINIPEPEELCQDCKECRIPHY